MKKFTADQISAMKKQTIGVEIEMYNITRKQAIEVIAKHFGTMNTVSHDGGSYDTYSCRDSQGRTWKMSKDVSIKADYSYQTELGTPILTYADLSELQEIVRKLRKAGALSDPDHGCGVHIHIGAADQTPATLRNLSNIMASHEALLKGALNLDERRVSRFCKMVDRNFLSELNAKKPQTLEDLAEIWYTTQHEGYGRSNHYNGSRYHMLNLHSFFTKGTVEFRLFQFDNPNNERKGGLHAGMLKAFIQLCIALTNMAKMVSKASCKPQQSENPKYAMRTWLLRLGFIGAEFETAREILTRNLDGDAAFRSGFRCNG